MNGSGQKLSVYIHPTYIHKLKDSTNINLYGNFGDLIPTKGHLTVIGQINKYKFRHVCRMYLTDVECHKTNKHIKIKVSFGPYASSEYTCRVTQKSFV